MNPGDLDYTSLKELGNLKIFEHSTSKEIIERSKDAHIIICNKTKITRALIENASQLKCICVTATGYNNVDIAAAKEYGIPVCNVAGYSTTAVAQHVFAMMSALQNKISLHNDSVQKGDWSAHRDFCYTLSPIHEFAGKTMGIYGFGRIGQQVAKLANAYGMHVIATHKHPIRDKGKGADFVEWETLLKRSDYLSLHAPLNTDNQGIINEKTLQKMKATAVLINTGRGGLINEKDLRDALQVGTIAAATLDVLSAEPPAVKHPLLGLNNCLITPHIAWASVEARETLLEETVKNVKAFINGEPRNVVNK
jgi:glycerate dehydrogenase